MSWSVGFKFFPYSLLKLKPINHTGVFIPKKLDVIQYVLPFTNTNYRNCFEVFETIFEVLPYICQKHTK